jgi:hypothetical protein
MSLPSEPLISSSQIVPGHGGDDIVEAMKGMTRYLAMPEMTCYKGM